MASPIEQSGTNPSPPRRRWFQFSIRTLLIANAVAALCCGYVAIRFVIPAERQRTAARVIREHGGQAQYEIPASAPSWWQRKLEAVLPDDYFYEVTAVHWNAAAADDAAVGCLKSLPHLHE